MSLLHDQYALQNLRAVIPEVFVMSALCFYCMPVLPCIYDNAEISGDQYSKQLSDLH